MSEATGTAFGFAKYLDRTPLYLLMTGNDHLRYTLTVGNGKRLIGEVYEYHAYLATIIGINGSR